VGAPAEIAALVAAERAVIVSIQMGKSQGRWRNDVTLDL
jgi:hypothetical protein